MSDTARVASAYVEIVARKAAEFDREVRRVGQEAGKAYAREFEKQAAKASTGSKGKHVAEGKRAGAEIGDAAGKEAGERIPKRITERMRDSRGRFRRDGEEVGDQVGKGADRSFRDRFLGGMRNTSNRASRILQNDIYKGINSGITKSLFGGKGLIKKLFSITALGAAASSVSGLATVLSGAVGGVVALSGAVGLLPGVLASAGIAAAALKIGVSGVSDAFKASSDPKAYAEALKGLSPAAASFTKALVKLKPEMKDLRNSVQDGLFKGADKEVAALGSRYLPIVQKGLTEVSQAFGRGRRSVAEYLNTAKTASVVSGIFDDTGVAAGRLSRTFQPFAASFLDIASVGTSFLPDITAKLGDAAERFAAFTARTKGDGSMRAYFQDGLDAVGDLGNALKGAGRILGNVFKAGGGANTSALETFAGLLNKVADQIGRPEFQTGLGHFFNSFGKAGEAVGDALPRVADALVNLEPAISRIVAGSGTALASILTTTATAATAAAPTLNFLAGVFQGLAPHAGAIVIALLAVKGALLGLKTAESVSGFFEALPGRFDKVSTAAGKATGKVGGLAVGIGKLGGVLAVYAAVSAGLESLAPNFDESAVSAGRVTAALKGLQGGAGGLDVGSFGKDFSDLGKQLKDFSDPSLLARVEDSFFALGGILHLGGSKDGRFQRQAAVADFKSLDSVLTGMVQGGQAGEAAKQFDLLNAKSIGAGRGVSQLANHLPQFTSSLEASGGTISSTTGKVTGLGVALDVLKSKATAGAAGFLSGRDASRNYQAALDAAREAAKRNGKTLDETTAAGRENAIALDAVATAGLNVAASITGKGATAQDRFRTSLQQTRADLIKIYGRFSDNKAAAERYADALLKIPKSAHTDVFAKGTSKAIRELVLMKLRIDQLHGKTITITQRTFYDNEGLSVSPGAVDRQTGKNGKPPGGFTGGLVGAQGVVRRAAGGYLDPKLGGPRQDNVPLMVSGGEFVMNAFATAQPGVLALLRKINASNQYPQKLASGGSVRRASAGLNDITDGRSGRIERIVAAKTAPVDQTSSYVTKEQLDDVVDRFLSGMEKIQRQNRVYLDGDVVAGSVYRHGGRF